MKRLFFKYVKLSENNKIIFNNIIGTFLIKGIAIVISLFTMPIYLNFFKNKSVLGLWFTILSVLTWILNFDLGIGNGLRNKLTVSLTKQDFFKARKYLTSAYISIGALCIVISIVFIFIFNFINWNLIFNIEEELISKETLRLTIKIVFLGIMLQMFFKMITFVLHAMQKSALNNLLLLVTSILTIIGILLIPSENNSKNIINMGLVNIGAINLPLILITVYIFRSKRYRMLCPIIKEFDIKDAKEILSLGGTFLYIQVMYMLIMNTNEYMISIFYRSEYVVEFQIYYKLLMVIGTVFSLCMTPVWSVVTKAIAEGNLIWIKKLKDKLIILAFFGTIIQLFFIPFLQNFVNFWLGKESININPFYAFSFVLLGGMLMFNGVLSSIANGLSELKTQVVCFSIGALLKIYLSWTLNKFFPSWILIIWINILILFIYCFIQNILIEKYLNKSKEKE